MLPLYRGYSYNDWLSRSPETDDNVSNSSEDNVHAPLRKFKTARLLYHYNKNNHRPMHILHRASFHSKGITN